MKFYSLLVVFFCKDFHINLVFFFVLVFHYYAIDHNTIREPDTNSTRFFLHVLVEYNHVLVKFVLTCITRLIKRYIQVNLHETRN